MSDEPYKMGPRLRVVKEKKAKKEDFHWMIALHMGEFQDPSWPPFPEQYAIWRDPLGIRLPIAIGVDKTCKIVPKERVIASILEFCWKNIPQEKSARMAHKEAVDVYKLWLNACSPFSHKIKTIALSSEDVYAWNKVDLGDTSKVDPFETPLFNELLSRTSNRMALIHFIGSLFIEDSDRQQYLYLYGEGGNGKSALCRFLEKLMGLAFRSEQVPAAGDRFWTSGLLGARLVVFPDCNNYGFIKTGLFKALTGSDPIRVELKGGAIFSAKLDCKFIFLSNEKPAISGEASDTRRVIYCEMQPFRGTPLADNVYDVMLWKEGPALILNCIEAAQDHLRRNGGKIQTETDELEAIIASGEERFASILDNNFECFEDFPSIPNHDKHYVTGTTMQQILYSSNVISSQEARNFKKFLETKYKIRFKKIYLSTEKGQKTFQWRYLNIKTKGV